MIPAIAVPIGRILAGDGSHLMGVLNAAKTGDMATIARESAYSVAYETIGYDYNGTFDFGIIARNIGLISVGYLTHMIANKLGANRYMKNIPIVGKYISI